MYKSIMAAVAGLALLGTGVAFANPPAGANGPGKAADRQPFAQLKAQLKLTPAQEPAWNELMNSMKAMHRKPAKPGMKKGAAPMTAPEFFDRMAQYAEQRAQRAQALARAVKKFYGQLTPVQRAVMDTHIADARKRMMHHRHGMRHWGRPGQHMAPPPAPATAPGN